MHIGFVAPESPFESGRGMGIASYLRAVVPELIRRGHRVTVIAGAVQSSIARESSEALRVVHVRLPNLHWYLGKLGRCTDPAVLPMRQLEWSLTFARVARHMFSTDPVDVIESAETGALLLSRIAPLIIRLHGSDHVFRRYTGAPVHIGSKLNHRMELNAWRRATALTSPSHFQRTEALRAIGGACRVEVVPNPIALDIIDEGYHRNQQISVDVSPMVLYTGRLAPVKGTEVLLEAARIVCNLMPATRIVLIGPWQMADPPERWGLRRRDYPAAAGISWLGPMPWQHLAEWYRRAQVFVMPSFFESFGIACLEAMAFSVPVVATRAGGLPEVVEDGISGLLVPPGDPQSLAEAIITLLNDPAQRSRMGVAGHERVLESFTPDCVVSQMETIYRAALIV
jgi:glycogen(starch) synthase